MITSHLWTTSIFHSHIIPQPGYPFSQMAIRPRKKKPCSTGATDHFFPICWFLFFFTEKNVKSAVFWTKISMKNCERSEQEKIMIFKLFSGNFGKKIWKFFFFFFLNCTDRPIAFWHLFAHRTGFFFFLA